jgi:hypothetical protein
MRGHEAIIAMRKQGQRPAVVFLNDYPCETSPTRYADHATVDVSADQPEWADMRFLVGLRVSITGATEKRAKRFLEACKAAGAASVGAGTCTKMDNGKFEPGWSEIWHKVEEKSEAA